MPPLQVFQHPRMQRRPAPRSEHHPPFGQHPEIVHLSAGVIDRLIRRPARGRPFVIRQGTGDNDGGHDRQNPAVQPRNPAIGAIAVHRHDQSLRPDRKAASMKAKAARRGGDAMDRRMAVDLRARHLRRVREAICVL